jgi:hypothetical protein
MEQGQQWKWNKENLTDPSAIAKNILPGTKNYIRDEMLGLDDFGNVKKHAESGNWLGALKSGLTGLGEIALTVASAGVGTGVKAAAKPAVKAAVKKAAKNTVATQAVKKAESTAAKPRYSDDTFAPKAEKKPTEGYPVNPKTKTDDAPKAKVKEDAKTKKPSKLGRAATLAAGYGLANSGKDKNSDKWTPSAIV